MGTPGSASALRDGRATAQSQEKEQPWEAVVRLGPDRGKRFRGDFAYLLEDFSVGYLVKERGLSPNTGVTYRKTIHTAELWAGRPFWEINSDALRDFQREAPKAKKTKQLVVGSYQSLHRWALLQRIEVLTRWSPQILAMTPMRADPPGEGVPLPPHVPRILLENCRTPLETRLVYLGLYAGTRCAESMSIGLREWRGDRLVFIGKGAKERKVPIHPELERVKGVILSCSPVNTDTCHKAFRRMRERLGILDAAGEPATLHTLRKTFSDHLYDTLDVPEEVIDKLLGHAPRMIRRYAAIHFPKLQAAVLPVDYYAGEPVQLSLFT